MRYLVAALLVWAAPVAAVTCEDVNYNGNSFTACTVDVSTENLRLFHKDAAGDVIGSFSAIAAQPNVTTVPFAMNAGMYHDDRSPVGHYREDGVDTMRVITNAGPGNFGLLPNGVFCINDKSAQVYETLAYVENAPACRDATQSGPMLVIDGELHPRFLVDHITVRPQRCGDQRRWTCCNLCDFE